MVTAARPLNITIFIIIRLCLIVRVNVVLNRTVVVDNDWCFENLCGSHLQSSSLWLWRWLLHRLSKRQSLSTTTTVLLRSTFTRTIKLNLLKEWLLKPFTNLHHMNSIVLSWSVEEQCLIKFDGDVEDSYLILSISFSLFWWNENLKINYAKQMSSTKHITGFRLERVPRQIHKSLWKTTLGQKCVETFSPYIAMA